MAEGLPHYLQQVAAHLLGGAALRIQGDLNLALLDWDTDGVLAREAAAWIRRSADWA